VKYNFSEQDGPVTKAALTVACEIKKKISRRNYITYTAHVKTKLIAKK